MEALMQTPTPTAGEVPDGPPGVDPCDLCPEVSDGKAEATMVEVDGPTPTADVQNASAEVEVGEAAPETHERGCDVTVAWVGGRGFPVKKTIWPRGPLQLFKLETNVEVRCALCRRTRTDYRFATVDRRWAVVVCGPCYDRLSGKKFGSMQRELDGIDGRVRPPPPERRDAGKRPAEDASEAPEAKAARVAKPATRMCAILIGYCGTKYCGLQVNPGVATVEQAVIDALVQTSLLPPTRLNELHRHSWQRASRTDKGVHAARNILSVRLTVEPEVTEADIVAKLNGVLPSDVRVFAVLPTTKHFNAKQEATHRTYQYVVPSFAFLSSYQRYFPQPLPDGPDGVADAPEAISEGEGEGEGEAEGGPTLRGVKQEDQFHLSHIPLPEGCFEQLCTYRISSETLQLVRQLLQRYEGTSNYHNFTKRMKATDPQAMRYITRFMCSDPYELRGLEMLTLEVRGQSFLLNQIRKMIGMVIIIVSGQLEEQLLRSALDTRHTVNIPPAPGLGLILMDVAFDRYKCKLAHDMGGRKPVEWPEVEEEIEVFRQAICAEIVGRERTEQTVCRWLYALQRNVRKFMGLALPPTEPDAPAEPSPTLSTDGGPPGQPEAAGDLSPDTLVPSQADANPSP